MNPAATAPSSRTFSVRSSARSARRFFMAPRSPRPVRTLPVHRRGGRKGNFLAVIACFSVIGGALAQSGIERAPKERYIVTLREDVAPESFALQRKHQALHHFRHAFNGFTAELDETEAANLRRDKQHVLAVDKDGPVSVEPIPKERMKINALAQPPPQGLIRMGIPPFPLAHLNGVNEAHNVDVAVVDSGIDPHEDLEIHRFYSAFSLDGNDDVGHGTSVAGVIGALDNGLGTVGVASGVRIWNVKSLGFPPNNSWTNFLKGIDFVVQNAAEIEVVNISIGNTGPGAPVSPIRGAIRRLVRAGVVVVAAAGNANMDLAGPDGVYGNGDDALPASLAESMAVSAMDPANDLFWIVTPGSAGTNFSSIERPIPIHTDPTVVFPVSTGGAIDVAAPGVNIYTTAGGIEADGIAHGYGTRTGTSFATPHVAGLVALYIAANGRAYDEKGVYKIRQAIIDQCQALQPQTVWAQNPGDPDTNPEALAYPSDAWVPKPTVSLARAGNTMQLTAATAPLATFETIPCSIPGYRYTFQYSNSLLTPDWIDLFTVNGDGMPMLATDSDLNPNTNMRFYRVEVGPAP
jgi:subtilisin